VAENPAPAVETRVAPAKSKKAATKAKPGKPSKEKMNATVEEAKCPVCRKLRAVKYGVFTDHQQGLAKRCVGSRKKVG
jgi:hypothetical protein